MVNLILVILTGLIFISPSANYRDIHHNIIRTESDSIVKMQVELNVPDADLNELKIIGDSVEIPPFDIEVVLSKEAEAKLKKDKETVIVRADFSGVPIENLPKKYQDQLDEMGELFLLSHSIELTDSRLAEFRKMRFSKQLYDVLKNKDISVFVFVYSGRISTDSNLLDCEVLQDSMHKIGGKRFTLRGKLIND